MKIPDIIIYDFDGVICDSVNIKTEAFVELYQSYGKGVQQAVKEYHLAHGGISRYEKFRYFQSVLLGESVNQQQIDALADQFSLLVKQKVIASNYLPGVIDFLKANKGKKQFICTGTPQNEIEVIVKKKELKALFEEVYGSPKTKTEIIQIILEKYSASPNDCIFFGDAMTDYDAAKACSIPFIGIINEDTEFPEGTILLNDFSAI
jgi:HAD superfamily hydrolase (TIGR01509 family)